MKTLREELEKLVKNRTIDSFELEENIKMDESGSKLMIVFNSGETLEVEVL